MSPKTLPPLKFYRSTKTGELMRVTSPGFDEAFNLRTQRWQRTHTLDRWRVGHAADIEPVTELEARKEWPDAFTP